MISKIKFSTGYTSFWHNLFPTSEQFIRMVNLQKYERISDYRIETKSTPQRRAYVNVFSFLLANKHIENLVSNDNLNDIDEETYKTIEIATAKKLSLFQDEHADASPLTEIEKQETHSIAFELIKYIRKYHSRNTVTFDPAFKGCGFLNQCEGDILAGDTLYEVKAGDRYFRSVDIRQLITYAALNYAQSIKTIKKIGLINPRLCIFYKNDVDDICMELSGKPSVPVFEEIIYFLSSGTPSK